MGDGIGYGLYTLCAPRLISQSYLFFLSSASHPNLVVIILILAIFSFLGRRGIASKLTYSTPLCLSGVPLYIV